MFRIDGLSMKGNITMKTASFAAIAILAVLSGSLAACSGGDSAASQKEISKQRSGDYVVLLLNDTGQLKQGENTYTLEFRIAFDNSLVDVGEVQASTRCQCRECRT